MTKQTDFATIDLDTLHAVNGGDGPAPRAPGDYSTNGNVVQQTGQMIDNAASAFQGARKAGASWYEALGNATIGLFNLDGGFDRNGRPRN